MVVDSDVIIDFFRNSYETRKFFLSRDNLKVSRVTIMAATKGVKTKKDLIKVLKQLDNLGIRVIEINAAISETAWNIFWNYFHKFGVGILDSYIAATALVLKEPLVINNLKHYKMITGLKVFRPD